MNKNKLNDPNSVELSKEADSCLSVKFLEYGDNFEAKPLIVYSNLSTNNACVFLGNDEYPSMNPINSLKSSY